MKPEFIEHRGRKNEARLSFGHLEWVVNLDMGPHIRRACFVDTQTCVMRSEIQDVIQTNTCHP